MEILQPNVIQADTEMSNEAVFELYWELGLFKKYDLCP